MCVTVAGPDACVQLYSVPCNENASRDATYGLTARAAKSDELTRGCV